MSNQKIYKRMKIATVWLITTTIILGLFTPIPLMQVQASSLNLSVSASASPVSIASLTDSSAANISVGLTNHSDESIISATIVVSGSSGSGSATVGLIPPGGSANQTINYMVPGSDGTRTEDVLVSIAYTLQDGTTGSAFAGTSFAINVAPTVTPPPPPAPAPTPPAPSINLLSPQQMTLYPGEVREVGLTFRNNGIGTASEIITSIGSGDEPFTVEIINNLRIASMPANGERTITLRITVDADAEPGTRNFPVAIAHVFRTTASANNNASNTLNIRIGGEAAVPLVPAVQITNFRGLDTAVEPGSTFTVTADVQNTGQGAAHDVQITLPTLPEHIILVSNPNDALISVLEPGQTRTVSFFFQVSSDAPERTSRLAFHTEFNDSGGRAQDGTAFTRFINIIDDAALMPAIQLTNFRGLDNAIEPGDTFSVLADVQNTGQGTARNVQITLPTLPGHIIMTSNPNDALIPVLETAQTHTLAFTFQTSDALPAGTSSLIFNVNFDDSEGRPRDAVTFTRFINIIPPDEDAEITVLQIRSITAPSGVFATGQRANFSLELYNTGDTALTNISVTASPPTGIDPMSQITVVIPSLAAGARETVAFSFAPGQSAGDHTHTIRFDVDFRVNGVDEQLRQFAALNVFNPDDDDPGDITRRPWIVVDDFFTDPPLVVRAGMDFTLTMTFRNTSDTDPIYNARIVFTPVAAAGAGMMGDVVFIPTGGSSNTLFIDHIPPGGIVTQEKHFFTVGDAMPRSYTVRIDMEYQAPGFERLTDDVNISIRVSQFTRLATQPADVWIPPFLNVNEPIFVEFSIVNTGRVNVDTLRIRIEEENVDPNNRIIDASQFDDFVGALVPQRWLPYRGRFIPLVPGPMRFDIILYGEDPTLEPVEHRIPFEVYVMDPFGGGGDWGDPWDPGFDPWPGDPGWPMDPWPGDPGWPMDPWPGDPGEEEELGFWRRVWRWLTTPIGGYAGVRRNQNGNRQDMPHHDMFWGDAGYFNGGPTGGEGGIELLGGQIIAIPGGGGVVVGRPMPMPIMPPMDGGFGFDDPWGMDPWGEGEAETDSFFIYVWNFVRMPIFLFPFGILLGVGITLITLKVKRRRAAEMDFDE